MFSRKPQTALTTKKNIQRNYSEKKKADPLMPGLQPLNGFVSVNGISFPL